MLSRKNILNTTLPDADRDENLKQLETVDAVAAVDAIKPEKAVLSA